MKIDIIINILYDKTNVNRIFFKLLLFNASNKLEQYITIAKNEYVIVIIHVSIVSLCFFDNG